MKGRLAAFDNEADGSNEFAVAHAKGPVEWRIQILLVGRRVVVKLREANKSVARFPIAPDSLCKGAVEASIVSFNLDRVIKRAGVENTDYAITSEDQMGQIAFMREIYHGLSACQGGFHSEARLLWARICWRIESVQADQLHQVLDGALKPGLDHLPSVAFVQVENSFSVDQPPSLVVLKEKEVHRTATGELSNHGLQHILVTLKLVLNQGVGCFRAAILTRTETGKQMRPCSPSDEALSCVRWSEDSDIAELFKCGHRVSFTRMNVRALFHCIGLMQSSVTSFFGSGYVGGTPGALTGWSFSILLATSKFRARSWASRSFLAEKP